MTTTETQWREFLSMALRDHLSRRPDDQRTDREVLTDLMEHFVRSGTITKRNGKYVLPMIVR